MNIDPQTQISDIVTTHPATIPVFERLGIDYCCGGRVPLDDACRTRDLDTGEVLAEISGLIRTDHGSADSWQDRPLGALLEHIVVDYHAPMRRDLEIVGRLMDKVLARHGEHHPEMLPAVSTAFTQLQGELLAHTRDEEAICFPHIRQLLDGSRSGALDVRTMLPQLTREHIKAGALLRDLRVMTHHYTPPPGACPSFRALFAGLEGLERELHRHVHLENNVLFPRAAALEAELELQHS
jgi:regulator of cell morphogenesis and NO signaling